MTQPTDPTILPPAPGTAAVATAVQQPGGGVATLAAASTDAAVAAIASSYDRVPYESKPFAQTHPAQLAGIARLFGMHPAKLATARVLEIGCASGGNIIPLAANYPQMQVVGVELSPIQAGVGQALVAQMGLGNIQILTGDIAQYASLLPSAEPFDYILCHGVFSWVPPEVQNAILALCNTRLSANGIAYISYNTYPGWKLREVLREMMLFHAGPIEEPARRLQQGRAIVEYIRNISDKNTAFGKLLATESELVLKGSDYYIHHEFLEQDNRPLFFKDFMALAMAHGLTYLGEANFAEMAPQRLGGDISDTLGRLSNGNVLATEQYMDLFTNRFFRQTLLVKTTAAQVISRNLSPQSFAGLHISCGLTPIETPPIATPGSPALESNAPLAAPILASYRDRYGRSIGVNLPITKMVIDELLLVQPAPLLFHELVERVVRKTVALPPSDLSSAAVNIGQQLLQLLVQGAVTVHDDAMLVPAVASNAFPKAFAPAQCLAANASPWVPTRLHQALGLPVVELGLLALLDGTRDTQALQQALLAGFLNGRYNAQQDGQPVTGVAELAAVVAQFVSQALPKFQRLGLL